MSGNMSKGMESTLKKMLTTLEAKVNPSHTALVVVDMQNDFCASGGAFDREGFNLSHMQAIVPRLTDFVDQARRAGSLVVYIQTIHVSGKAYYASDVWLEQWKRAGKGMHIQYPVCEKDTWGADFCSKIKPLPDDVIVQKHRYSAFIGTDLDCILRSRGIRTLIISGIATNICVEMTAKIGFMLDYYILFLRDCTATISEELHNNTLNSIAAHYGEVVDSSDVVKCWKSSRANLASE